MSTTLSQPAQTQRAQYLGTGKRKTSVARVRLYDGTGHEIDVGAAHHLPDVFEQLLRAERFGCVEPAVNPDDGLAFLGERTRLFVAQSLGVREPRRDLLVARELLVVLRRGHDRHQLRAALGRLADGLDDDARRLFGELLPVGRDLLVVGEEVVVAEVVAELLERRGDVAGRLAPFGAVLMEDMDKETVDFVPNYDETRTEPTIFPAAFPNLLVNGGTGIAVGMATNMAPHNLGEVIDGIDHPIGDHGAIVSVGLDLDIILEIAQIGVGRAQGITRFGRSHRWTRGRQALSWEGKN